MLEHSQVGRGCRFATCGHSLTQDRQGNRLRRARQRCGRDTDNAGSAVQGNGDHHPPAVPHGREEDRRGRVCRRRARHPRPSRAGAGHGTCLPPRTRFFPVSGRVVSPASTAVPSITSPVPTAILTIIPTAVASRRSARRGGIGLVTSVIPDLAVARSVLQARPADWSLASELGWFDQCSWLLSTPRLCGLGLICNVATLSGDNKLETCSVSAAWEGQCSVGAWSGWQGLQIATSCSGQICTATKTCSWNHVQIGVAGQPLASDLGWFDQCSWLLST